MWTCPKCGERHGDELVVCWACGTSADGTEDPSFRLGGAEPSGRQADVVPDGPPIAAPRICGRCGSGELVLADVCTLERSPVGVLVRRRPEALFFTGVVVEELRAAVCAACGHAELYVPNARELLRAAREASRGESRNP